MGGSVEHKEGMSVHFQVSTLSWLLWEHVSPIRGHCPFCNTHEERPAAETRCSSSLAQNHSGLRGAAFLGPLLPPRSSHLCLPGSEVSGPPPGSHSPGRCRPHPDLGGEAQGRCERGVWGRKGSVGRQRRGEGTQAFKGGIFLESLEKNHLFYPQPQHKAGQSWARCPLPFGTATPTGNQTLGLQSKGRGDHQSRSPVPA